MCGNEAMAEAAVRAGLDAYFVERLTLDPARLNAIPWTRVCITCKEKQNT